MKNKELITWLILLAWQLTWIIPIGIAESQKVHLEETPMITEWEDILLFSMEDINVEVDVEPLEIEPVMQQFEEIKEENTIKNLGMFKLTAYCSCEKCCFEWSDGITASGTVATEGRTVAVDPKVIPYGTVIVIDGHEYIAEDCSVNYIHGNEIDIFFDSHEEAKEFGIQYAEVFIKESN